MRVMNRAYQRGITLTGLIFVGMILLLITILGMKVIPDVIEYAKIVANIKAVAQDPALRQASAAEVRNAYTRRAIVDHTSAIEARDIDVTRDGNTLVLSFAYRKEIRLFGPVSLVIDFEAATNR
jgi:Tfp pilus assembly protein PilX